MVVRINLIIVTISSENSLPTVLHDNRIDNALNKSDVGVRTMHLFCNVSSCSSVHELCLRLLEHLFLLNGYPLSLNFFLLSNLCFMLRNFLAAALTTPSLTLSRLEIICPLVTLLAFNKDRRCVFNDQNVDLAPITIGLCTNSLHDLDTVVTYALGTVRKLPESDLTPVARLLRLNRYCPFCRLLQTPLLNYLAESVVTDCVCSDIRAARLSVIVVETAIDACSNLFACFTRVLARSLCSHVGKVWSVDRYFFLINVIIDSNVCKHCVNRVTGRLRIRMRSMSMRMMMMVWMTIIPRPGGPRPLLGAFIGVRARGSVCPQFTAATLALLHNSVCLGSLSGVSVLSALFLLVGLSLGKRLEGHVLLGLSREELANNVLLLLSLLHFSVGVLRVTSESCCECFLVGLKIIIYFRLF